MFIALIIIIDLGLIITNSHTNPKKPIIQLFSRIAYEGLFFLAILVTGGQDTGTSAEILHINGTRICDLPPIPMSHYKSMHTQSGLTACGGFDSETEERTCITFQSGTWTTLTENLLYDRDDHSSWVTPSGDILLIGGPGISRTTTEIVYQNGTSMRSFDLKYKTR